MATHAHRYPGLDLPHPLRAAAPFVVVGTAALAFEADPRLPVLVGVVAAACFYVAAGVRGFRCRRELAAVRRTADRLIVSEPHSVEGSDLVRWRTEEITSRESRDELRRELDRMFHELDARRLPSASPLHRPAARANEPLLRQIAGRIGGSRPVSARGMLLARGLLHDGASPLYADDAAVLLPRTLQRVLGALEP